MEPTENTGESYRGTGDTLAMVSRSLISSVPVVRPSEISEMEEMEETESH
jgi:hypothetical protein